MTEPRKADVLFKFIKEFKKENNRRFPAIEIMASEMETSKKRVYHLLGELRDRGLVERIGRYGFDTTKK